eukprot:gene18222-24673_t
MFDQVMVVVCLQAVRAHVSDQEGPLTAEQEHLVEKARPLLTKWIKRLNCLVVGPGMGDDPLVQATAMAAIRIARELNLPLLVDGSGINVIVKHPDLVRVGMAPLLYPKAPRTYWSAAVEQSPDVGLKLRQSALGGKGMFWQVRWLIK